ncbi:MAG: hypothetical protein ACQEXJ_19620 [Myxococcota bacterium]
MRRYVGFGLGAVGLVAVSAVAFWTVGGGTPLQQVASQVPNDALAVVATGPPSALLQAASEQIPDELRDELLHEIPFDPFDDAAWTERGFDPDAPVGAAFLDPDAEAFMVTVGLVDAARAREVLASSLDESGALKADAPRTLAGVDALVLDEEHALLFEADRLLLVGGYDLDEIPGASDSMDGLELLARRVLEVEAGTSMASNSAFESAAEGMADAAVATYVDTAAITEHTPGRRGEVVMLREVLGEVSGVALGLVADSDRVELRYRAPLPRESHVRGLLDGPPRSEAAMERIPGPVLLGVHASWSMEALREVIDDYTSLDRRVAEEWREARQEFREETGLGVYEDLLGMFTGEVGYVIDEWPPPSNPTRFNLTAFAGVDEEQARETLDALVRRMNGWEGMRFDRDEEDDRVIYTVSPGRGAMPFRPAVALADDTLWLSMHEDHLRDLLADEAGSMLGEGRSAEVAEVVHSSASAVAFCDVREVVAGMRAAGELEDIALGPLGAAGLVEAVDRVESRAGLDGEVWTGSTTVYFDEEAFDGADGPAVALLQMVSAPAFLKYMRRAKTTEAIDQLDKIYKGAALYYTTPHVNRRGNKLDCQFPTSTECIPKGSPCDYPDNMYPADPSIWTNDTWSALNFQISEPHYFRYCFDASGTLSTAGFTATAHADLDCDGEWSTFQRMGFGDPNATKAECSLQGSAAFYVEKEVE